jgi:hypothetical protein
VFTLRCTAKLLKRLKVSPDRTPPRSTTKLGDWYANLLYVDRQQLILCVSEVTLLPVLLRARGAEPLAARLPSAVAEVLAALGVPDRAVREETAEMNEVTIAATASRTVLGSMNDFAYLLEGYWERHATLLDLALQIADSPCSPLNMERPRDVAVERLARPALSLVK